jgi:hypothetical protein
VLLLGIGLAISGFSIRPPQSQEQADRDNLDEAGFVDVDDPDEPEFSNRSPSAAITDVVTAVHVESGLGDSARIIPAGATRTAQFQSVPHVERSNEPHSHAWLIGTIEDVPESPSRPHRPNRRSH